MNTYPRPLTEREHADIAATVASLTIDQKASLTAGRDMWTTCAIHEAGITAWRMTDGPNGARGGVFGPAGVRALCMPSGAALGATWDVDLVHVIGEALGRETRSRGARFLLGPTVNIQRSPLAGRTFECFSEDPLLTGALAAAYVQGAQGCGIVTTVKHFAGNEAEFERASINSIIDERALREIYLAPFEMAVTTGGTLGVMTAYNRLNGSFCADSKWLLADVLRDDWGFQGIVVSDWWALVDTKEAAYAGLDIEMPGPARTFGPALAAAVRSGDVAETALDAIAVRLLETMTRIDARDDPAVSGEQPFDNDPVVIALARRAAADAMVLMSNRDNILPLMPREMTRIAVIGPNAVRAQIMGGGSATLRAPHFTTPLDAIRAVTEAHEVTVDFAAGCALTPLAALLEATELTTPDGEPGLAVSFFNGHSPTGKPVSTHRADASDLTFMGSPAAGVSEAAFSLRAVGSYFPSVSGLHRFTLASSGAARAEMDGEERAAIRWEAPDGPREQREATFDLTLEAGQAVELAIEFAGRSDESFCQTALRCLPPEAPGMMEVAEQAASAADVAVIVVGTSPVIESEGFDRRDFGLPGRQDELVRRVLAANPRTIVVVNSGSPVAMPWFADVPATLHTWFGGQEMAAALADVLFGTAEPGGRAPISFPGRIEHGCAFGNFPGEGGEVRYGEGVLVGYRWFEARDLPVAVPFGHGLGYTHFAWTDARLSAPQIAKGDTVTVSVTLTNSGTRPGAEVVQVYVSPPQGTVARPVKELRGFAKVRLDPGESREVCITLAARAFSYWYVGDEEKQAVQARLRTTPFASAATELLPRGWTIDAGEHEIHLARSSADIVASLPLSIADTGEVSEQ